MSEWQTIRRETGLIEHKCEHGIGHSNPASSCRIAWHNINSPLYSRVPSEKNYRAEANAWTIHGCDGCCQDFDFPGEIVNNLLFAFNLYVDRGKLDYLQEIDVEVCNILEDLDFAYVAGGYGKQNLDWLYVRVAEQGDEWRLNYMTKAEFMFWPLEALRVFGV
jgi:hypothetical protein